MGKHPSFFSFKGQIEKAAICDLSSFLSAQQQNTSIYRKGRTKARKCTYVDFTRRPRKWKSGSIEASLVSRLMGAVCPHGMRKLERQLKFETFSNC